MSRAGLFMTSSSTRRDSRPRNAEMAPHGSQIAWHASGVDWGLLGHFPGGKRSHHDESHEKSRIHADRNRHRIGDHWSSAGWGAKGAGTDQQRPRQELRE